MSKYCWMIDTEFLCNFLVFFYASASIIFLNWSLFMFDRRPRPSLHSNLSSKFVRINASYLNLTYIMQAFWMSWMNKSANKYQVYQRSQPCFTWTLIHLTYLVWWWEKSGIWNKNWKTSYIFTRFRFFINLWMENVPCQIKRC